MLKSTLLLFLVVVFTALPLPSKLEFVVNRPYSKRTNRFNKDQISLTLAFVSKLNIFVRRPMSSYFRKALDAINRNTSLSFHGRYRLEYVYQDNFDKYSPPEAFLILCEKVLGQGAITLFLLSEAESYDNIYKTVSAEYLINMANFLGLPVMTWSEDTSGLVQPSRESTVLQMTPSIEHQVKAMLSLLKRYGWKAFSIVTGTHSGYEYFINTMRRLTRNSSSWFEILTVVTISYSEQTESVRKELSKLDKHEARVMLLYARQEESEKILAEAKLMGQTSKDYIWILCKAALGGVTNALGNKLVSESYYPGLLALDFTAAHGKSSHDSGTSAAGRETSVRMAVNAWAAGIEQFIHDMDHRSEMSNYSLSSSLLSCQESVQKQWREGVLLAQYIKNSSTTVDDVRVAFNEDGTMKDVKLRVMNLDNTRTWKEIGEWSTSEGLHMGDITWPGGEPTPPVGKPTKYHLKVVTLQERPFVVYSDPDPNLGTCPAQSDLCRVSSLNLTQRFPNATRNKTYQCCSGFCIDLLRKLSEKISFDYELFEVPDRKWGAYDKTIGEWNGLIKSVLNGDADMIVTSLQITPDRSEQIDFSVPFLETGITIMVLVRAGVISPKAFLEPYDFPTWCLILIFSVHLFGANIFVVEWLSPRGLDKGKKPISEHKFSLFRSFWLIWSMLFGAAVNVDIPRGVSSRFLANIWAFFAVVFTASYTANLAVSMITKEDYDHITGLRDKRLTNPMSLKPAFKFGTVPYGSTESNLKKFHPSMYDYMRKFNKSSALEGVRAVRDGELNAFIYDATVLEYLASIDDGCKLKTVPTWNCKTGYGIGFPKGSKWMSVVNKYLIQLEHNGELERLHKFWFAGSCKNEVKGESSKPLGILNFTSAFILLACGMILGTLLMIIEHIYFKFFRAKLRKYDKYGCCSLVSLSLGRSLTFRQSVKEALEMQKSHKCKNTVCEMQIWKLQHELDLARLSIVRLQGYSQKDACNIISRKLQGLSASDKVNSFPERRNGNEISLCKRPCGDILELNHSTYGKESLNQIDTLPAIGFSPHVYCNINTNNYSDTIKINNHLGSASRLQDIEIDYNNRIVPSCINQCSSNASSLPCSPIRTSDRTTANDRTSLVFNATNNVNNVPFAKLSNNDSQMLKKVVSFDDSCDTPVRKTENSKNEKCSVGGKKGKKTEHETVL